VLLSVLFGFPCSLGAILRVLGTRRRSRGFQPSDRSKLNHAEIMKSSTSSMSRTMDSTEGFLKIDDFTIANFMLVRANRVNSGMYLNRRCSQRHLTNGRNGSVADILPQIFRLAAMRCEAALQLASWRPSQNGQKRLVGLRISQSRMPRYSEAYWVPDQPLLERISWVLRNAVLEPKRWDSCQSDITASVLAHASRKYGPALFPSGGGFEFLLLEA
jgi:hypothetical protein